KVSLNSVMLINIPSVHFVLHSISVFHYRRSAFYCIVSFGKCHKLDAYAFTGSPFCVSAHLLREPYIMKVIAQGGILMNLFMTTGTYDFMKKMREKHPNETMVLMQGENTTLLLHETEGKTIFQTPRRYEVVDGTGTFKEKG